MRLALVLLACLAFAPAARPAGAEPAAGPEAKGAIGGREKRKVDVKLDEKTAVKIAEIVLAKVYGDKVLEEKPWKVTADKDDFKIEGTLPKGMLGGVALIRISRANAEVIEIIHGR